MAKRHADDLVFYATIGVILGGRIGYVLFYAPGMLLDPLQVFKLWDGGMSFHGGVIGTSLAMIVLARRKGLDWLRVHDYVACRSEEHTSELQSLMRISYAVFCLKTKTKHSNKQT